MKTRLYILAITMMLVCLPIGVQAVEHNFAAGSLIIPMDQFYQPDDAPGGDDMDGGILEAYGLVYYLLAHQDQDDLKDCDKLLDADERAECIHDAEHDITVYWLIDEDKTDITDPDLIIDDDTDPNVEVVKLFNRAGGAPTALTFDTARGDGPYKITYRGGIWAIDLTDLKRDNNPNKDDLAAVEQIIREDRWQNVQVHVSQVPFWAKVHRKMRGKPPRIALLNSQEDPESGNAKILESYLRLAGICQAVYDVLSPNQVGGVLDVDGDSSAPKHATSGLFNDDGTLAYQFLWAPHWTGQDKYDEDINEDGVTDVDEIVAQVRQFLKSGGSMLAECASIETFKYNVNGKFLTDHGLAHNGGTNDENLVAYNDVTAPYSQIGDFGGFEPEGGHLHNWRPFKFSQNDEDNFNFDTPPTQDSNYNDTVTRYTVDDENQDGVDALDWDYYVGGYAYGKQYNGYVVYLGGHKYAECKDDGKLSEVETEVDVHPLFLEFKSNIDDEKFTLTINYHCPHKSQSLTTTFIPSSDFGTKVAKDDKLQVDFTNAFVKKKKIEGIELRNLKSNEELYVDSINLSWADCAIAPICTPRACTTEPASGAAEICDGGVVKYCSGNYNSNQDTCNKAWLVREDCTDGEVCTPDADLKIKKLVDEATDNKHYNNKDGASPLALTITQDFMLDKSPSDATGPACSYNQKCEWTNVAGVRYVLNTLFNIQYMKGDTEFARAAPVVAHPYLYQGFFGWEPRSELWIDDYMVGHFRRYDVTQKVGKNDDPVADWDTADNTVSPLPILLAATDNSDGRKVYTAKDDGSGGLTKTNFDFTNIDDLRVPLDLTPNQTGTDKDDDEELLINRVRGKRWNPTVTPGEWVDDPNRLGGIMHSAAAIVRDGTKDSRFLGREEMAYVGDMNGMLHAVKTATGEEKWAYIPSNLLPKLKNVRGDPAAVQDFAAVDASPTVKNIYYDFSYDPEAETQQSYNPSWYSILVCPQGFGGNSIFALDVTDPDNWEVLWETDGASQSCTDRACTTEPPSGVPEPCHNGVVMYCPGNYNQNQDTCNKP